MAQRIPQEVIEEVRHRTNIVDIVLTHVIDRLKNALSFQCEFQWTHLHMIYCIT